MAQTVLPGLRRILGQVGQRQRPPQVVTTPAFKQAFLREIDIFHDLAADDLAWLEQTTRMLSVPAGAIIYYQADTVDELFLLKRGRVRLSRLSGSGKKLDLALLEPGTFFGEMPLLGERTRNATAEAVGECILCVLSQRDVEQLIQRRPAVALRMLGVLGQRLAESEARLEDLAYRSVPARLASALLRLGHAADGLIEGTTHQELGDLIGAYRETVTKTLDDFKRAGYVELGRRRIRILDRRGLAALLEE